MASRPQLVDLDFGTTVAKIINLPDPTSAQDAATRAWVLAMVEGNNWKDSVRFASTANINLASPGSSIDGVTPATSDRFLAKDQTTASQCGIYIWNGAAVPATRALDADAWNELEAAIVVVEEGTANAGTKWRQTAVNGTLGSTSLVWVTDTGSAPAASETTAGIAEIATQAETDTGTDDTRFVTPLKLTTFAGGKKKFAGSIGNGSATTITVSHNCGTSDVQIQLKETGGSKRYVDAEIRENSSNPTTQADIIFNVAPASNAIRCIVIG